MPTLGGAATRIALALAIGLFIGFEREWSNKDAGIRTCALTALLGMLAALVSPAMAVAGLAGVLVLIGFINWRVLRGPGASLEITTSAALLLTYVLGALVGQGEFFTPVAAAIAATLLLTWKIELHRFAGELRAEEIRSAIWLGALAFVIYPLLPNRDIDRWGLVNPHEVWVVVIVVAAVGFANYILMRLYSARGLFYSAVLGGFVNSAATVLELGASLRVMAGGGDAPTAAGVLDMGITVTLLATIAALARNLLLLAIFFRGGLGSAWPAMLAMGAVAAALVWRRGRTRPPPSQSLRLPSPVEMGKVLEFGLLFLVIQIASNLAHRAFGHFGVYAVAVVGGFFNSSGTVAAMGELARQHQLGATTAGVATVLTSMATVVANAPLMNRQLRQTRLGRDNQVMAWGIVAAGAATLALTAWLGL